MRTRANYLMVEENDPQWCRFWDAYPSRVAKKDARKAWMDVRPSPDLVDRMLTALEWQSAQWSRQGYGTPYPASWLRAERWTDEPPPAVRRQAEPSHTPWSCPHLEECAHKAMCRVKDANPSKYPVKEIAHGEA